MKNLLLKIYCCGLFALSGSIAGNCQWENIKGKWVDSSQRLIQINDTIEPFNTILNRHGFEQELFFRLKHDTLRFYNHYTTSNDNYSIQHTDDYEFKLVKLTDTFLIIEPISDLSKKVFGSADHIKFTRKEYLIDRSFRFDKIIFHAEGNGWGATPISVQIDSLRNVRYFHDSARSYVKRAGDPLWGNRKGKLSEENYTELLKLIMTSNITDLKYQEHFCCDGSVMTFIVYINSQRFYIKSMFLPKIMDELIYFFYNISRVVKLERTSENFVFEE